MTDFELFTESLWEYKQTLASNPDEKMAFSRFISKIEGLKCNDFRWFFFIACHQNNNEENAKALKNIEKAIQLLDKVTYNVSSGNEENTNVIFYKNHNRLFRISEWSARNIKKEVFYYAGEIAAKNNNNQDALKYYQTALYYKSFLKTKFENKEFVKIYTYRTITPYAIADIVNDEITVTSPTKMNDPFDSIITLWASEENLMKTCSEHRHIKALAESFKSFRIRSFTTDNRNVLMWSHYANEHNGICLKYRLSGHFIKQEQSDNNVHMYLKKVKYQNNKICLNDKSIDTDLAIATKKNDWKYEKEVRLISYDPTKQGDYLSIPLDSKSYIEAVYFGYRCDEASVRMIRNLFKTKKHQPLFYKMELNPNDVYRLAPRKL